MACCRPSTTPWPRSIVGQGLAGFFWDMSKSYPNQVAMVKIDRKGNVTFDRSFHRA